MRDERGLDLERPDPVAGRDDQVIGAALEVQVAVLVLVYPVAGTPRPSRRRGAAEVSDEERRVGARIVEHELPVLHAELDAGQRQPHRAGARRHADRHAGQLAGLGLAVAVADLEPEAVAESADHLGVERLAGGHQRAQRGQRRKLERLAITRYSVGAMHSTSTLLGGEHLEPLAGSKRASCSSAAAPRSHGAMNTLRADFDQPLAAVHHTRSPGSASSQCSACSRWPPR